MKTATPTESYLTQVDDRIGKHLVKTRLRLVDSTKKSRTNRYEHRISRERSNSLRPATTLDPPAIPRSSRAIRRWAHPRGRKRCGASANSLWRSEAPFEGCRRVDRVHLPQSRPCAARKFSRAVPVQRKIDNVRDRGREFLRGSIPRTRHGARGRREIQNSNLPHHCWRSVPWRRSPGCRCGVG